MNTQHAQTNTESVEQKTPISMDPTLALLGLSEPVSPTASAVRVSISECVLALSEEVRRS